MFSRGNHTVPYFQPQRHTKGGDSCFGVAVAFHVQRLPDLTATLVTDIAAVGLATSCIYLPS
jgi:hypothetical protein